MTKPIPCLLAMTTAFISLLGACTPPPAPLPTSRDTPISPAPSSTLATRWIDEQGVAEVTVVFAAEEIPAHTEIAAEAVATMQIAEESLPEYLIVDLQTVIGNQSRDTISRGSLITADALIDIDWSSRWPLAMADDFEDSDSGFLQAEYEGLRLFYEHGLYTIEMMLEGRIAIASRGHFTDFEMEVDVLSRGDSGRAGAIFRKGGDFHFYDFRISPDGRYSLRKVFGMEESESMLGWRESPHINTGPAANHLKVVCVGPEISLYVNGQYLDTAHDTTFTHGEIGVAAGNLEGESYALFDFDNLRIYAPTVSTPTMPTWALTLADNFSDPESGFVRGDCGSGRCFYEDGLYAIEVARKGKQADTSLGHASDLAMEVDVISDTSSGLAGVVFRAESEDEFYVFIIDTDGGYKVRKHFARAGNPWEELTGWEYSPHILSGNATNRLGVVCSGSEILLYANGHYLDTVADRSFKEGQFGLVVGTFCEESHALFHFDNLLVYEPSGE